MNTSHRTVSRYRARFAALTMLLWAAAARADAPEELVLSVQAHRLSQAALKKSLEDELASTGSPAAAGTLTLTDEASDVVRIRYRDAAGNVAVRDLRVASDDPELIGKVSVAAANLMRSQDELVQELRALAPAAQPAAPPPTPVSAPPSPPAQRALHSDFTPSARLQKLMQPSPDDPCAIVPVLPLGADLAPWVGTSSVPAGRDSARHVSLSLLASYSRGTRGVTLSAGANLDLRGTCGAAFGTANAALGALKGAQSGVANFAHGGVRGAQLGTFNAATGGLVGAQLGAVNLLVGHLIGAQGGTVALTLGNVVGVQGGVAAVALGSVQGAQLGVASVALGDVQGLQAGVADLADGSVTGAQVGLANVALGSVEGAQVGLGNVATGNATVQLGLVNYAHGDNTFQLGLVNVARDTKASVGLIDVVRRGRTSLDAWATENGTMLVGVTHGSRVLHNVYGVGGRVGSGGARFAFTYGLGARMLAARRVTLDLDLLAESLLHELPIEHSAQVLRARLAASVFVTERIAVLAAAGYAFGLMRDENRTQAPFGQTNLWKDSGDNPLRVSAWPSFALGVRVAMGERTR